MSDRISLQFRELQQSDIIPTLVKFSKSTNNAWIAVLNGPSKTSLQNHSYQLEFKFPSTYPSSPPRVTVLRSSSSFFKQGNSISELPILNEDWTPFFKVSDIVRNIEEHFIEKYSVKKEDVKQTEEEIVDNGPVSFQKIMAQSRQQKVKQEGDRNEHVRSSPEKIQNGNGNSQIELDNIHTNPFPTRVEYLKKHLDQITDECQRLQKVLNHTNLTVMKNSYTKQIEDYSELRNNLWVQYFKLYQQGINKQLDQYEK